jgi:hypothetical protein
LVEAEPVRSRTMTDEKKKVVTRLPGRSEILVPSASTETVRNKRQAATTDVESPPDLFGKASL